MIFHGNDEISELKLRNGERWFTAAEFVSSLKLKSYKVICPLCREEGIPFPKWQKGVTARQLYIIHNGRDDIRKICKMSSSEVDGLNSDIKISKNDILKLIKVDNIFVLFSGGKDSLCTLAYVNEICNSAHKKLKAIFIDTTIGFPEIKNYVKKTCNKLGVRLRIVKPQTDYFTLAKDWGIPTFKSRWCCRELKIKPVSDYLSKVKGSKIVFDGIRSAESNDRAKYFPLWYHPGFDSLSYSPLFFWSDKKIERYIKYKNLPKSPVHDMESSCECWCGAYKRKSDFEKLFHLHPDIYNKLIEVEEANPRGFTFIYKNGLKTSLKELKKEIQRKENN